MRSIVRLSIFVGLALSAACAAPSSSDSTNETEGAQTAGSDILKPCPAFEDIALSSDVTSDQSVLVRQTYRQHEWDGARMLAASHLETHAQNPSTLFQVRFYRDSSGHSKFQLSIGTFAGMEGSIEGAVKTIKVAGTVTFDQGSKSSGVLTVTSRRDGYAAILGDIQPLRFDGLDCAGGSAMNLTLPLVTLDKTSDETVEIVDSQGNHVRVTPTVRWVKKADTVTLAFADMG